MFENSLAFYELVCVCLCVYVCVCLCEVVDSGVVQGKSCAMAARGASAKLAVRLSCASVGFRATTEASWRRFVASASAGAAGPAASVVERDGLRKEAERARAQWGREAEKLAQLRTARAGGQNAQILVALREVHASEKSGEELEARKRVFPSPASRKQRQQEIGGIYNSARRMLQRARMRVPAQ